MLQDCYDGLPPRADFGIGVQGVFGNIKVESGEGSGGERVDSLHD